MRETRRVVDGPGGSRYTVELGVEIEGDELTEGLQGVVSSVYGGGGDLGVAEGKERVSKAMIECQQGTQKGQERSKQRSVLVPATRVDG
jgi:hypothetical protein